MKLHLLSSLFKASAASAPAARYKIQSKPVQQCGQGQLDTLEGVLTQPPELNCDPGCEGAPEDIECDPWVS